MRSLFTSSLFAFLVVLGLSANAQTNVIEGYNAFVGGTYLTGVNSEENKWGWSSTGTPTGWGQANTTGVRYVDNIATSSAFLNSDGTNYVGRSTMIRYDSPAIQSSTWTLGKGDGLTTTVSPFTLTGGVNYTLSGILCNNLASAYTYSISVYSVASASVIATQNFTTGTTAQKMQNFSMSFSCPTSGSYLLKFNKITSSNLGILYIGDGMQLLSAVPIAKFAASAEYVPTNGSVTFTDQSMLQPTSWKWTFDGGTPAESTLQNPVVTYSTPGEYTVKLVASNLHGSDSLIKTASVKVGQTPVIAFKANATSLNVNSQITFTDSTTNKPTSWSWSFPGGTPSNSTLQNPTVTYATAGNYDVSLTATNPAGQTSFTKTGYIQVSAVTASKYYVSKNGNDANDGSSLASAFKTISKAASVLRGGDTCFIAKGVYRETVTPTNSGTIGNPIVFTKYKNDLVTIVGTDSILNWQLYKGGIYKAYVKDTVTQLSVNNKLAFEARYPNSDGNNLSTASWASVSVTETGSATITGMNSPSGYWNGATFYGIVADKWVAHNGRIDQSSGNTLHCIDRSVQWKTTPSSYYIGSGKGYITNHLNALDAVNEWHWQNDSLYYYPADASKLNTLDIEARTRLNGFNASAKENITISGINFAYSTINMEDAKNCTIDSVKVIYPAPFTFFHSGFGRQFHDVQNYGIKCWENKGVAISGYNNTIRNSYVAHSWGDGISIGGQNNTVNNCLVEDCDWIGNDDAAVATVGVGHKITRSTLRNTGRSVLVHRLSNKTDIMYNNMYNAGYLTGDLGITYTFQSNGMKSQIAYNWVHDNLSQGYAMGVYLDNADTAFVVHHNVIWNVGYAIHTNLPAVNHEIYNNTVWKCANAMGGSGTGSIVNQIVKNNLSDKAWSKYTTTSNNLTTSAPLFTDAANNDYTLQTGSPAIDYGVAIPGITDSFTGTAPDAGAYEQGVAKWTPGMTGITPMSPIVFKQNQTITFDAIPKLSLGLSDIIVNATASSNLNTTLTSSDPSIVSIVNGNLHIVATGTCTITANQPGDENYNAAPSVSQSVVVDDIQTIDNNINNSIIKLFPNPATNKIKIQLPEAISNEIEIRNTSGQLVLNTKADTEMIEMNVSGLVDGVYFVTVKTGVSSTVIKFMIKR